VATVLVVEDDEGSRKAFRRAISPSAPVLCVGTIRDAHAALREPPDKWLAAVVDVGLPDGDGIELAKLLAGPPHFLPVLVMTGDLATRHANAAHLAGARFAYKPIGLAEVEAFLRSVLADTPDAQVARAFAECSSEWALSEREREIVELALRDVRTRDLSGRLDASQNTVKSQVRALLAKAGAYDLDAVVRAVLRRAITKRG
jgi:DNA-binding NarL/FixJ family response regulator